MQLRLRPNKKLIFICNRSTHQTTERDRLIKTVHKYIIELYLDAVAAVGCVINMIHLVDDLLPCQMYLSFFTLVLAQSPHDGLSGTMHDAACVPSPLPCVTRS